MNQPGIVIASCPICSSGDITPFIELPSFPVLHNVLWSLQSEAVRAPRGKIELCFCHSCGHVFNRAFDPVKMEYTQDYENSLHFSDRFQQYALELAAGLVEKNTLKNKNIIEIGCGQGDFLALLCDLGGNKGIGFDPSYHPDEGRQGDNLEFIRDYYSEKYASLPADFICCRQVLEHIYQPASFLQMLRRVIGDRLYISVFFEVPNVEYTIFQLGIWDILYEHFSYFSPQSLERAFTDNGFNIKSIARTFGEQFLTIDSLPAARTAILNRPGAQQLDLLAKAIHQFASNFDQKIKHWQEQLDNLKSSSKRAVVWGAGTKGISFLNLLNTEDVIEYIVDINPRKKGMHVTGAGQMIVQPEFLQEHRPDYVILMNKNYTEEVQVLLDALGIRTVLLHA